MSGVARLYRPARFLRMYVRLEDFTDGADASAQAQDSEALWDVIVRQPSLPRSVLIVRGQVGREWLGEQMRARGIEVQAHIAYEREVAVWPTETVRTLRDWAAQGVRPCLAADQRGGNCRHAGPGPG